MRNLFIIILVIWGLSQAHIIDLSSVPNLEEIKMYLLELKQTIMMKIEEILGHLKAPPKK